MSEYALQLRLFLAEYAMRKEVMLQQKDVTTHTRTHTHTYTHMHTHTCMRTGKGTAGSSHHIAQLGARKEKGRMDVCVIWSNLCL